MTATTGARPDADTTAKLVGSSSIGTRGIVGDAVCVTVSGFVVDAVCGWVREKVAVSVGARVGVSVGKRVCESVREMERGNDRVDERESVCGRVAVFVAPGVSVASWVLERVPKERVNVRVGVIASVWVRTSVRDVLGVSVTAFVFDVVITGVCEWLSDGVGGAERVGVGTRLADCVRLIDCVGDGVGRAVRDGVGTGVMEGVSDGVKVFAFGAMSKTQVNGYCSAHGRSNVAPVIMLEATQYPGAVARCAPPHTYVGRLAAFGHNASAPCRTKRV
jgi:hypothetical protein